MVETLNGRTQLKGKMKIAYIAGPYRAGRGRTVLMNIRSAELIAIRYWILGYAVICPHLNTAFLDGIVLDDQFLKADLEFVKKCDVIVMMPNYLDSIGAIGELDLAKKLGKEIIYT